MPAGIVVDENRTVYFTSREGVWRAEVGQAATAIVGDVHSHWLALDSSGGVVGEYSESAPGEYWRWADGEFSNLSPAQAAIAFGATIAGAAALPLVTSDQVTLLVHDGTDSIEVAGGGATGHADGPLEDARFGPIGGFVSDGRNGLFLTSGGQLRQVKENGVVQTLLGANQGYPASDDETSDLLGIDIDYRGRVYVADRRNQSYLRYDPARRTTQTLIDGDWRWAVAGIRVDSNEVYVLEYDRLPFFSSARVRRIDPSGEIFVVAQTP